MLDYEKLIIPNTNSESYFNSLKNKITNLLRYRPNSLASAAIMFQTLPMAPPPNLPLFLRVTDPRKPWFFFQWSTSNGHW